MPAAAKASLLIGPVVIASISPELAASIATSRLEMRASDSARLRTPLTLHQKTTGAFSQVGTMALHKRRDVLGAIVSSLPAAFADTGNLEMAVDELFGDLLPAVGLGFGEKPSGLMQVADADPAVHRRLYFLSRSEPALGLCMGTVAVQPIPASGLTVFELRSGEVALAVSPAAGALSAGAVFRGLDDWELRRLAA